MTPEQLRIERLRLRQLADLLDWIYGLTPARAIQGRNNDDNMESAGKEPSNPLKGST